MAMKVGTLVNNRYRIVNVLAKGGMGAIYKARDESLGVSVALKENLFATEESSKQFHREATLLAGLRHSNLPRVTDHFVIPGKGQYLVMDFIEGEDLKQMITKSGQMKESTAIETISKICHALEYLHTRTPPIVHRDIKPGNIKCTPRNDVYLVDFGLAKENISGEQTAIGAQALTPGYAPPEQYGKGTDPRSDIYSLAATLYSCLTGKIPPDGLARAMGHEKLIPIQELNPNISAELDMVVNKAMAVYPEQRYQSIKEFRSAILGVKDGDGQTIDARAASQPQSARTQTGKSPLRQKQQPPAPQIQMPTAKVEEPTVDYVQHPPPGYAPLPVEPEDTKPRRSSFMVVMLIVFLVISVVGLSVVGYVLYANGMFDQWLNKTTQVADVQPSETAVEEQIEPSHTILVDAPATSTPASEKILEEPTNTPLPTDTPQPTLTYTPQLTPIGGGVHGQIAFASDRLGIPQIYLLDVNTGEQEQLTQVTDGACNHDWSPDGQQLVYVSPCRKYKDEYVGSRLFLLNLNDMGQTPLNTLPGGDFDPAWSPDGLKLAFSSTRKDQRPHIFIYTLEDNTVEQLSPQPVYDRRPVWSPDGQYLLFETTRGGTPEIWYMKPNGDDPTEFSRMLQYPSTYASWTEVGNQVIYSQGSGLPWLVTKSFDNIMYDAIQVGDIKPVWDADFSPDGSWITFYTVQDVSVSNIDIYMMMSTGADVTRLTSEAGTDFHPVWRP